MIDDKELMARIEDVVRNYKGDITHMNEAVGMVVVGRLIGWEHQRLVTNRDVWTFSAKIFGDLKAPELMPKRGVYAYKSVALALADKLGGYRDIVIRKISVPMSERRIVT